MKYNTIIWDLDGTLLDTLQDLCNATNHALRVHNLPERSYEEVRCFVGNGVRNLILRAVPQGIDDQLFDSVFSSFRSYYIDHCRDTTCLYRGIKEVLMEFHAKGIRQAIVSNKLQAGVTELFNDFFRDCIEVAIGEREGINRKPAPDMVRLALSELSSLDGMDDGDVRAVYIGDSDVDIATATNSQLPCISVLWGFRDKDFLLAHGAETLALTPHDIVSIVNP